MDVITMKVISGVLFFLLVIFFGGMPFWILRKFETIYGARDATENKLPIVSFLHSMASGVLVATCMLSLLPEAIEAMHEILESLHVQDGHTNLEGRSLGGRSTRSLYKRAPTNDSIDPTTEKGDFDYPVAELLIAIGFLCIYMLDCTIKSVQLTLYNKHMKGSYDEVKMFEMKESIESRMFEMKESILFDSDSQTIYSDGINAPLCDKTRETYNSMSADSLEEDNDNGKPNSPSTSHEDTNGLLEPGEDNTIISAEDHPLSDHVVANKDLDPARSNQLRSVALVGALCVHTFFDGILLGLQTSRHVLFSLLLALSVHKTFVSISLSLTLYSHHDKSVKVTRVILYIFLFALMAPLGLTMSAAFVHGTATEEGTGLTAGCLQAFAVGTFMYVAFTETMEQQHKHGGSLMDMGLSHLFMLGGFAAMAGLRAALGEV